MKAALVADDDPDFRELVAILLRSWNVPVVEASDFREVAIVAKEKRPIGLVLLDYFMPGDRAAALEALNDAVGNDGIVLCTACGEARELAAELRIPKSLDKPVDLDALAAIVRERL